MTQRYNIIEKIGEPIASTVKETVTKYQSVVTTTIMTAILLLATLAWNDVVQTVINSYYPKEDNKTIRSKVNYAVTITIFVILVQIYVFPYIEQFK